MKTILMAIGLIITLSLLTANGQTNRKSTNTSTAKMDGCISVSPWEQNSSEWDVGQNLPTGLKKEELIKSLHPAPLLPNKADATGKYPEGEVLVGVGAKPWKYLPDTRIVILETKKYVLNEVGGVNEKDHALSLAVIKQTPNSSTFTVIAKTSEPIKFEKEFHFNRFDLAAYKLNETDYAFGLRRCVVNFGTGYIDSYEALDLFRLSDENIEQIFSAAVWRGHFGIRDEREDFSRSAIISVAPEKTNGYFNLIKRFGKAKPAVFKWDGKKYQTTNKDPFEKFADPNN